MIEKNIEINGVKIFTRIAGEGDPFLILHGWGASSKSWIKIQEKLSENFKVFSLDFPGFGKSDLPPSAWEVQDYVHLVLDYAKEIELKKFHLLGHSFGGRVCIKLAAQFPEKIDKLFLIDTAGIKVKNGLKIRLAKIIVSFLSIFKIIPGFKFGRKIFYRFVLRQTDYLKARGVMKETFKKVIREDLTPLLKKITAPTLIVWGEKDKMTPIKDAYLIKQKIKNSKLEIFDCGHSPHLDMEDVLVKTILDFLK